MSAHPHGNGHRPAGVAEATRIVLRPLGSPLPLGLLALVPAGVLLSLQQLEVLHTDDTTTIATVIVTFVVPLQLVAMILSFLARDTVAGTALGLFCGAWLLTGVAMLTAPPGTTSDAQGVFLLCVSAAFLVLVAGAAAGKAGPALVIVVGATRFALTGLYELTDDVGVRHAAAIVGLVLACAALYSALATEIEDVHGEMKLPLGRRKLARSAIEAPFEDQLTRIEHEAGVRQQL